MPRQSSTLTYLPGMWPISDYRVWLQAAGKPSSTVYLRCWHISRFAETHPSPHITTADLATWLGSHGWAPATIASVRASFRSFWGWMHTSGRMRTNPALGLPAVRIAPREPRPAPEWVLEGLRSDERVRLMIDLAARQGLRRAEIASVHSRDLVADLDGWSLIVHGKGDRDRMVPLHDDIAARLRGLPYGWAFPGRRGHLSPNRVGDMISGALPSGWTAHSLRRRFATRAYAGGRDLRSVQRLLGHASIETTQRYVAVESSELRAAVHYAA